MLKKLNNRLIIMNETKISVRQYLYSICHWTLGMYEHIILNTLPVTAVCHNVPPDGTVEGHCHC